MRPLIKPTPLDRQLLPPAGQTSLAREREAELAEIIATYWRERGFQIQVKIVPIVLKATTAPLWCVRSDLVSGLPRGGR
jgi:hypothetical protein